jgi:vacuolar-type H+-ATPase subunit C/Vma6
MMWDDLAARARGLGTHVIDDAGLAALGRLERWSDLGAQLRARGLAIGPVAGVEEVDLALRRRAADDLRTLARWARERLPLLAALFEAEDVRSIRAIARGVAAAVPVHERVAGLLPTPALPEAALGELARQPSAAAVAALLVAWRNPYGPAIADEAASARPEPFVMERALDRAYAARAASSARRAGAVLAAHVAMIIDSGNVFAALALAADARDVDAAEVFVEGGRRLGRARFVDAVGEGPGAAARLASSFAPTALQAALESGDVGSVEEAALATMIDVQKRIAALRPTSLAPVILLFLRRRAEARAVRRAAWRIALGPAEAA